jgi:hypothetical protein
MAHLYALLCCTHRCVQGAGVLLRGTAFRSSCTAPSVLPVMLVLPRNLIYCTYRLAPCLELMFSVVFGFVAISLLLPRPVTLTVLSRTACNTAALRIWMSPVCSLCFHLCSCLLWLSCNRTVCRCRASCCSDRTACIHCLYCKIHKYTVHASSLL